MNGMQKTIYEAVREILSKIESGVYGKGDEVNADALKDDFADTIWDIEE